MLRAGQAVGSNCLDLADRQALGAVLALAVAAARRLGGPYGPASASLGFLKVSEVHQM